MSDDEYGPPLPPGFNKQWIKEDENKDVPQIGPHHPRAESDEDSESQIIGPCIPGKGPNLPPALPGQKDSPYIGPCLPQGGSEQIDSDIIGPCLPPALPGQKDSPYIGPCLPQGGSKQIDSDIIGPCLPTGVGSIKSKSQSIGPCLPSSMSGHYSDQSEESEEEDCIGPLPSEMSSLEDNKNYTTSEFENRARLMKDRLEGKETKSDEKLQRESWMMELPSAGLAKNIGLTARTFRANATPDMGDRSVWTDTPADRERKEREALEGKSSDKRKHDNCITSGRDKQMAEEVERYNKSKRPQSLLEMHEKERKKLKKEKGDEPKVRRPFDREVDLQTNRFDEAQRQAIIKKSQDLNSRFSKGKKTSQFL